MYDVIIIGAGPAGISASIYSKRVGLNALVIYCGVSELEKAHKIENYYGFVRGITGKELYKTGINQARCLGIEILEKEVTSIEKKNDLCFKVKTENESFESKSIIIATGNKKTKPSNIKGIMEFEGKGVSYCAICDGFFYRNKNVVVIGNGKFAISAANDLENTVKSIKILTNGKEKPDTNKYEIDTRVIKQIHGKRKVEYIEFEDGDKLEVDGVFIAEGIAGGNNFAKELGIITIGDIIVVNENMQTNIDGIYACGDIVGGLLQVNKAVYEGAKAGLEVSNYIKNINEEIKNKEEKE